MLCCPAPLILPLSPCRGFRGASDGCAVYHLFPPWIREAVSPDLAFPLPAPAPLSRPRLSLACRHLSTALREAVPQTCLSVNPHYPRILDLAPHPLLSSCLDALLLRTTTLQSALRASHAQGGEKTRGNTGEGGLKRTDTDPSSNLLWKVSCAKDPHPH